MPARQQRSWLRSFASGLVMQGTVVHALALRELQQRFGRHNIGYLWIIVEPMLLASVVTLLHSLSGLRDESGMSPFTFTLTGYTIFIIFRNTFNRSESALHGAGNLMYHSMITPFDIVLSKSLVETIGCVSALVLLQAAGIVLGLAELPARPLYLYGAILLFAWWSFAWCLVGAAYGYISPLVNRLVHPVTYFAMPLSGAFITMSLLPTWGRVYMGWNPMMAIFEMARYGQFAGAQDRYMYLWYVIAVNTGVTYWGLLSLRIIRKHIHVS